MDMFGQINDFLVARFGELGPLYAVGALGVLLVALTLPVFLRQRRDPLDKLRDDVRRGRAAATADRKALRHDSGRGDKLDRFSSFLEPQTEEEMSSARLKMLQAGYRSKSAVRNFHALQFVLALGFLAIGLLYGLISSASGEVTTQQLVLAVIGPAAIGYFLPKYWVERRVQSRQEEIENGFPDSLDMMLVCVEAGQSMEQAILRVSKEVKAGYPALGEEFELVSSEMKAGKDKSQVLKDMATRAGVTDIGSFVTVMVQSAQFGTSLADALRVYAAEMRDKRVMRAEEKANKLPTKLTLGTMMFTVPPLLIILIGPSIYDIFTVLGSNGMP
ncbi:type II secretion system F family protein [Rhodovulum sp. 12E13]|uniref:type II secretion system F family protein n=1 Tax=Rhodovulum sp. 12E13 TaxID=2203891 RepID=UPI000E152E30|nr:type II secretion system F family protein [Rhodovulum sp. 12E13]RDC75339.1 type II secretion system F family protein [Rhodovulum sp. 12E13]